MNNNYVKALLLGKTCQDCIYYMDMSSEFSKRKKHKYRFKKEICQDIQYFIVREND